LPFVRILALDYGQRRIGVALSDPGGVVAQPLETVEAGPKKALARIAELVREYGITRIVVGLPVHMDGHEGVEAGEARAFGASVQSATSVPVEFLDERWTTLQADRALREAGVRGENRRGKRDRVAAALLLQTWLDGTTR
jgi:putative Holliday junction resolvase